MAYEKFSTCRCGKRMYYRSRRCIDCHEIERLEAVIATQRPTMPFDRDGTLSYDKPNTLATHRIVRLNRRWNGHYLT